MCRWAEPLHYPTCPTEYLTWEYRKVNLLNEIDYWDADVVCLQEVDEGQMWDDFNDALTPLGYTGLHKKRSGDKSDGCAIFWKTER